MKRREEKKADKEETHAKRQRRKIGRGRLTGYRETKKGEGRVWNWGRERRVRRRKKEDVRRESKSRKKAQEKHGFNREEDVEAEKKRCRTGGQGRKARY